MKHLIIAGALLLGLQDSGQRSKSAWGRWAPGTTVTFKVVTKGSPDSTHTETLVKVADDSCATKWVIKTGDESKEIDRKYFYVDERPSMNPDVELLDDEKVTVGDAHYTCAVYQLKKEDNERVCILTEWVASDSELPLRRTFTVKSKIGGKDSEFKREALALGEVVEVGKAKVKCIKYKERTETVAKPGEKPMIFEEQAWHSPEIPGFLVKKENPASTTVLTEYETKRP